jgi:hypothetical protein
MLAVPPTGPEPDTPRPAPQASIRVLAERGLRSSRSSALKHVSCDYRGGVLVLRGCLPSYYLKQLAQEAVASLEGFERIDNQIRVMPPRSDNDGPAPGRVNRGNSPGGTATEDGARPGGRRSGPGGAARRREEPPRGSGAEAKQPAGRVSPGAAEGG